MNKAVPLILSAELQGLPPINTRVPIKYNQDLSRDFGGNEMMKKIKNMNPTARDLPTGY